MLKAIAVAGVIAVIAGAVWFAYGEMGISEAARFDDSINIAHSQSQNMSASMDDAGTFIHTEIAKIDNIGSLLDEWDPRYSRAQSALVKFDAAIVAAERRADDYLAAQSALTEQIRDPARRARAQSDDRIDRANYIRWRTQAHSAREQARQIIIVLADMDAILHKQELASEFSFDADGFSTVPADILSLEAELEQFQAASDIVRQITASPFEMKQ